MMQTAEGALSEYTDIVQRMKDLALQAANGTNGTEEYAAMDAEFSALKLELKNIEDNTTYGAGTKLLTGGKFATAITFQIGTKADNDLQMDVSAQLTALTDSTAGSTQAGIVAGIGDQAKANTAVDELDTLLGSVGALRGAFGANINRLNHTINNLANMKDNTDMAKGRIMDADFAMESANMSKNSMLMQSGISMLKQAGQMPGLVMSLLG